MDLRLPSSDPPLNLTPVEAAGWLLAMRQHAVANGLLWPTVDEILAATNTSREDAYELADAALAALPALEQALSQPGSEPAVAHGVRISALVHEALGFVMGHPGCAQSSAPARYTAGYRGFVLALRKRYADIPASEFADVIALPLDTLEGWMRGGCGAVDAGAAPNPDEPHATAHNATQP
jgi:hypothetical protein